jgi:type VI secretion system secreted protein Hcp
MATNMYVRFEDPDIRGTSKEAGHEHDIEILSWSHGFAQPTSPTRSSGGVEQATHQNLAFTKYLDGATNELLKYCWGGKMFAKVTLICFRSDGARDDKPVEYLRVTMEHVLISNYAVSGGPGDIPVENVSLDYGIVKYQYKEQTQHGFDPYAKHDLRAGIVE